MWQEDMADSRGDAHTVAPDKDERQLDPTRTVGPAFACMTHVRPRLVSDA
jgi:hypothetical protein